jgi:hypothetical protein
MRHPPIMYVKHLSRLSGHTGFGRRGHSFVWWTCQGNLCRFTHLGPYPLRRSLSHNTPPHVQRAMKQNLDNDPSGKM